MPAARPNIVLIVADDHGRDTAAYGNPAVETPHLDALAAEGVRLTRAFCTTASCAASRSVILTGQYNHANGTYGHTHGAHHFSCFEGVRTLPRLLNQAGYRTARAGKQHYAPEASFPFQEGFADGKFGRDDVRMAEACRELVRGRQPFFLYWCSHNPHRSGDSLASHPCRPNRFGNPAESFPGDAERPFRDDEVQVPPWLPDTPEVRAELAQYCQSVARLDRGIGRLRQVLREEGKADETVVIYVSDNGAAFHGAKTTLYEPGMNLPCLVSRPFGGHGGGTCDGLVTWADLTPTILDFAGAEVDPEAFHGRSFAGILDQEHPTDWRSEVYAAHTFHEITNYYPMRVVRGERYKLIWNLASPLTYSSASDLWRAPSWQGALRDGLARYGQRPIDAYLHRPRFELYDLETDPHETTNLADRPEHAERLAAMGAQLRAFQERTNDPWVHKWEYE